MLTIKKIIITYAILTLFSCSSAPPFLSPSKALVNTSVVKMGKSIPQKYNKFLNQTANGNNIVIGGQNVALGEYFTSALGQRCRILIVSEKILSPLISSGQTVVRSKRIVCRQMEQDHWVLIPAIVEQVNNRVIFAD